jgi:hypothetical protein
MRSTHAIAATLAFTLHVASTASAVEQPDHLRGRPELELAPGLFGATGPSMASLPATAKTRNQRDIGWFKTPKAAAPAWAILEKELGPGVVGAWDLATGVPSRVYGRGLLVTGSVASPQIAEQFSRGFLARHARLLAPGASAADFVLVANDLDAGMRTVAFKQTYQGLEVIGGQVSFRFKNDRLTLIGSEARPHVRADVKNGPTPAAKARAVAEDWVRADMASHVKAGAVDGPFVLPLIGPTSVLAYRTVIRVTVEAKDPIGRFWVYLDEADLSPVARRQTLKFATGSVFYNAPVRWPGSTRHDYAALFADQTVNGATVTSDENGSFVTSDAADSEIVANLSGPLVRVRNDAGPVATTSFSLAPNASFTWNVSDDEALDSQLNAFIHLHQAKAYAKTFAPTMVWLDARSDATVNIDDVCNAFSDGTNVHFYASGQGCENTGRLPDVVYHEFGHSVHYHSIIPGTGEFEGGLSEGVSDYLAATMTSDSAMGRGFFYSSEPLRELDPEGFEWRWPEDVGEVHDTGLIIGGALWDLRKALVEKHGGESGVAMSDQIYYQAMRRAVDIPTMYPEALAADDDDGDLTNGTPNLCEIVAAFGAHGLRPVTPEMSQLGVEPPRQEGFEVTMKLQGLFPACPFDAIESAVLRWNARGSAEGELAMNAAADVYAATIPAQEPGTVVEYRVDITFQNGSKRSFPDNPADPKYQFYVGELEEIYCTDFEDNPFDAGWTHGLSKGSAQEGADDWQWGIVHGMAGSGDPSSAFSGGKVFGNDLGGGNYNGSYQPDKVNFALSPVVDVKGYGVVRLQYRRWLNVEDAHFDRASIFANDELAWVNFDSAQGETSSVQHQDKEWRFQDVDLTPFVKDDKVAVKFEIASDGGLEFGGWTIDDFCVMGIRLDHAVSCGNGILEEGEECDDGDANSDAEADACRTDCTAPRCGDGVVDAGEACDGGAGCDATCEGPGGGEPLPGGGGCSCEVAADGTSQAPALFAVCLAVALARRRRARRTP